MDLEGKKIGTASFCFTGSQSAPTSGYTRTRINGRGRKIRSGLRVDYGYVGTLAASELTLAQQFDNFTDVGIPPVFTPPLQEPPSKTVRGPRPPPPGAAQQPGAGAAPPPPPVATPCACALPGAVACPGQGLWPWFRVSPIAALPIFVPTLATPAPTP